MPAAAVAVESGSNQIRLRHASLTAAGQLLRVFNNLGTVVFKAVTMAIRAHRRFGNDDRLASLADFVVRRVGDDFFRLPGALMGLGLHGL
jgi:hypothetical protein